MVFGFIYSVLYLSVKNTLDNIGIERLAANTARFKASNETFSLIKEIKILGKEKFYVSVFGQATKKFIEKEILMQSISALPKYFIILINIYKNTLTTKTQLENNVIVISNIPR